MTLNIVAHDRYNSVTQAIYADTRRGIIESDDESAEERQFNVRLDEIFSIDSEKIHEVFDQKVRNDTRHQKRSTTNPPLPDSTWYMLEVEIRCTDLRDSKQLLRMLEAHSEPRSHDNLTHEKATLLAIWRELPECPPPGSVLSLMRQACPFDCDYDVELSMGWTRKHETPLEAYSKARRSALTPDQNQLPTPSASDESEKATKRYAITYVFMNQRYHVMENLKCPLCATESNQRALREHSSFERLHTHLLLLHDHFQPQIESQSDIESDSETSTIRKTVHLWLSDKPVERSNRLIEDGDEEIWVAPARPFDQKAYLRGEDTWTGHPKAKPPGKQGRSQVQEGRKQPANSSARQSAAVQPRPSISEIKDITDLRKIKYRLPKVPGIRFYRTVSKRPFESDEEVSESDDDVDESWLRARLQDDMTSLLLSDGGRDFYQDWNHAANEEKFSADKLTREGVVRFARKFQDKFRSEEYREEFSKFVTRLKDHGVIDHEVLAYCEEKAREMSHGLGRMRKGGESRAKTAQGGDQDQVGKTCTCGKSVPSARGAIICHDNVRGLSEYPLSNELDADLTSQRCSRVHFHMACVGLTYRPESWRCSDCCALDDSGEV